MEKLQINDVVENVWFITQNTKMTYLLLDRLFQKRLETLFNYTTTKVIHIVLILDVNICYRFFYVSVHSSKQILCWFSPRMSSDDHKRRTS